MSFDKLCILCQGKRGEIAMYTGGWRLNHNIVWFSILNLLTSVQDVQMCRMNPLSISSERFTIAEDARGEIAGCCQLVPLPEDKSLELRSLIVRANARYRSTLIHDRVKKKLSMFFDPVLSHPSLDGFLRYCLYLSLP